MLIKKKKFYFFLFFLIIIGYSWVGFNLTQLMHKGFTTCIIKNLTGYPCPSCGSTRSLLVLLKGDLLGSLYWNPFGIIIFLILIILPFWLLFDLLYKKSSLINFYYKIENFFKQPKVAIIGIVLVLLNWIWNIYKGL